MNIYYDNIIYYLQQSGGISRYWQELTHRLLSDESMRPKFLERSEKCDSRVRHSLNILDEMIIKESSMPLSFARYLPIGTSIKGDGIFHSSYYRVHPSKKLKSIVTVHDFTYEYYSKGFKKFVHSTQKEYAVKMADSIICVSTNTKRDLLKFYPYIKDEKIHVVHNGVSNDFAPSTQSREEILYNLKLIEDRYIIFIGERGGYKNFATAVKACEIAGCGLLVIGGKEIASTEEALLNKHLKNRYRHFGFVDNKSLGQLYSIAHCLIYPSLYEGFGIPVLEAMKCGCPVVASDTSSLPEAAGNAGILVKDITPEGFASAIEKLDDKEARKSLINRGFTHSARFSWDKCYAETVKLYKNLLQ